MKIHTPTFLFFLLACTPLSALQVNITGNVLSESGEPLTGAEIRVNDSLASTDALGHFSIAVEADDLYILRFSVSDHYPMIHSFSALEIDRRMQDHAARIADVTLVERKKGRIMLAFGGDTMTGRRFSDPVAGEPVLIRDGHRAGDTAALLQYIAPYLQLADYAAVNLESQVMDAAPEGKAPKSYVFFTPPETLDALANAGVDYVTLGNNHMFDYLTKGMVSTIEALKASPLAWSGGGRTEAEALQAHHVELGGNNLSLLGYVGWSGNFRPNQTALGTEKGGAALGSTENIRNTVRREVGLGYLPVVQYHGSREYMDEPTLVTETRLKAAIDEGAILAIGHHPHVTQGFEIYKGQLIAYSMGNFMFDQIQYATQRSFLLYVWMDGGQFHRAEAMPLHIKGYVPMPATDTVRQFVLKRINELSSRRHVFVQTSGGNAVILPGTADSNQPLGRPLQVMAAEDGTTIWSLDQDAWNLPIDSIVMESGDNEPVLLGKNLLPTGHLETFNLNGAPDRTWLLDGGQAVISDDRAPSGKRVMQLTIPAGNKEGRIGMRTFEQIFEPGTPTSFIVKARADAPARVTAYQQWRKLGENRLEALESAKLRVIGEKDLGVGDWQELRFNFDSPRVSAFSYRVLLGVTPLDSSRDFEGRFDDISLVEWLSPPLSAGKIPAHINPAQASHVGLSISPP